MSTDVVLPAFTRGTINLAAESLGAAAALEASHGTPRQRAAYLLEQGYALNTGERPREAREVLDAGLAALADITTDEFGLAADILATLGLAQAREGDAATGTATVRRALRQTVPTWLR